MLNPNIGKLIGGYENRYRLVIDVAHTARDISQKQEEAVLKALKSSIRNIKFLLIKSL